MADEKYIRPKIARARFKNPDRQGSCTNLTELEKQVTQIAESRTPQKRKSFSLHYYQYDAPFFYENFRIELGRPWENAVNYNAPDVPEEQWGRMSEEMTQGYVGAEFNCDGVELDIPPYGAITFVEDEPIVEVTVIGSACISPGYVTLVGEPVEWCYPRTGVKMRVDNLWGEHQRWVSQFAKGVDEGWLDTGLSCAVFRTPPCRKITIMAGSTNATGDIDIEKMRHDAHYCVRYIHVGIQKLD